MTTQRNIFDAKQRLVDELSEERTKNEEIRHQEGLMVQRYERRNVLPGPHEEIMQLRQELRKRDAEIRQSRCETAAMSWC